VEGTAYELLRNLILAFSTGIEEITTWNLSQN